VLFRSPSLSWMEAPRGDDERYHQHGIPAGRLRTE